MENVCSLPPIDHMTSSKPVVTSPIMRQQMLSPGHKTTSEPKGLPPLSALLQPNLSEIQRESPDPVKHHHSPIMTTNGTSIVHEKYNSVGHEESKQQQQHALRPNSPLFPHTHVSGQLNSPDHRPPQNSSVNSSQRAIDMRLPPIKHFENITNIQTSPVKSHQTYPSQSLIANMQLHQPSQHPPIYNTSKSMPNGIQNSPPAQQQYPNNYNHPDLLPSSHMTPSSSMWTRPTIPSPRQSQQSVVSGTSPQKAPILQTLEKPIQPIQPIQQQVRFVPNNNYTSDYQNNGPYVKDSVESNIATQNTTIVDKALSDMQKITDYCSIISQFATQYSEYRNQANNPFHPWPTPTGTPSAASLDQQVTEMINRTCEILNVLNSIKSEIGQTVSNDQDTINLIRTKRTTVGPSATRTKYRKRSKRAAPPGRCHSCNISETPEWRRGPDGARTLCNACGLHFAKLTRKRALSAMAQHQTPQVHKIRPTPVLPSLQPMVPKPPMGMIGGIHLAPPIQPQMMQSPPKRLRHDIPPINHQITAASINAINGNYLKA